jgi:flagellar assembly protein FliH
MLLSSNVIKQVGSNLENCSVLLRAGYKVKEEPEKPLVDILENVKKEANEIIINARCQAANLLDEAKRKALSIEKDTYVKGFQKGEQEALRLQKETQAEFCISTQKIITELEEIRDSIYQDTEREIVQLAIAIAEKIVARQLDLNPETIVGMAKAACGLAKDCKQVILYVAPEQIDYMRANQDLLAAQLYKTNRLNIIADNNIKSGGCRVETEQGSIEATVAAMFKQLESIMEGCRE